jgi:hypothetical protein
VKSDFLLHVLRFMLFDKFVRQVMTSVTSPSF